MASTYSDLKIELIGTGEQTGTWGSTTNTNLGTALEEAITGSADVSFSSADVTLTLSNTNGTQTARNLRLVCTGTSGGARNLILGSGCQINKIYLIQNDLADAVTVKNTTGTGVTVAAGAKAFVFNDGTNVVEAINLAGITGTVSVSKGGTGQTSYTDGQLLIGNTTGNTLTKATLTGTANRLTVTNGSGSVTLNVDATDANTANKVVARDGSGNFSAGTITAALTGAATQVNIDATTSSDTSTYPVLVGAASTGGQTPFVDTGLSYNANTNALTATTFVGALSGNASTATSAATWTTARTISIGGTDKSVNGSANVTWTSAEITAGKLSTASGSAPSYSARAWVSFDGTGTIGTNMSIYGSGNVASVYRNSTSTYTVTFTTAMPDTDYSVVGSGTDSNGDAQPVAPSSYLTTSIVVYFKTRNETPQTITRGNVVIFR